MPQSPLRSTSALEEATSFGPAASCPFGTYLLVVLGFALSFAILGVLI